MRKFFVGLLFFVLIACSGTPQGPEERIERLGGQLRCPVCRGVPINESPSTLATEMMQILKEQVGQGKSDEEILKYFEQRYGEWVRLQPKAEGVNLLVWILPALFLGGGAVFIMKTIRKQKESS